MSHLQSGWADSWDTKWATNVVALLYLILRFIATMEYFKLGLVRAWANERFSAKFVYEIQWR